MRRREPKKGAKLIQEKTDGGERVQKKKWRRAYMMMQNHLQKQQVSQKEKNRDQSKLEFTLPDDGEDDNLSRECPTRRYKLSQTDNQTDKMLGGGTPIQFGTSSQMLKLGWGHCAKF